MKNFYKVAVAGMGVVALTACNGLFDDIYDKPQEIAPAKGQIVMDATSWTNWYYVDLNRLHQLTVEGDEEALFKAQTEFEAYPIPMEATGERVDKPTTEGESTGASSTTTQSEKPGQYMYWFDVFGAGVKSNTFTHFTPTAEQTAPEEWSFAIHRNNVRTNGGAVLETTYTSMRGVQEHDVQGGRMDRERGVGQSGADAAGLCALAGHRPKPCALVVAEHGDSAHATIVQHKQPRVRFAIEGRKLRGFAVGELSRAKRHKVLPHNQLQVSLLNGCHSL